MEKLPCVYLLANGRNGTLYVVVTSDLPARITQHQHDMVPGFTQTYQVHSLVWYEIHPNMESAIRREKRLKKWNRCWKIYLIEKKNPMWKDLTDELL